MKSRSGKTGYSLSDQVSLFCKNHGIAHTFSFVLPEPQIVANLDRNLLLKEEEIRSNAAMMNLAWQTAPTIDALLGYVGAPQGQQSARALRLIPVQNAMITENAGQVFPRNISADGTTVPFCETLLSDSLNRMVTEAGANWCPLPGTGASAGTDPHTLYTLCEGEHPINEWVVLPEITMVRAPKAQQLLDFMLAHVLKRLFPGVQFAAADPTANWARTIITAREPSPGFNDNAWTLVDEWLTRLIFELAQHEKVLDIMKDKRSNAIVGMARVTNLINSFQTISPAGWLVENGHLYPIGANQTNLGAIQTSNQASGMRGSIRDLFEGILLVKPVLANPLVVSRYGSIPLSHADYLHDLFSMPEKLLPYLAETAYNEMPLAALYKGVSRVTGKFTFMAEPVLFRTGYFSPCGSEGTNTRQIGAEGPGLIGAPDFAANVVGEAPNEGGSVRIGNHRIPFVQPTGMRYAQRFDPRAAPGRTVGPNQAWMRVDTRMRTTRPPERQVAVYDRVIYDLGVFSQSRVLSSNAALGRYGTRTQAAIAAAQGVFDYLLQTLEMQNALDGYFGREYKPWRTNEQVRANTWHRTLPGIFTEVLNGCTNLQRYGISGIFLPFSMDLLRQGVLETRVINPNYAVSIENPAGEVEYSSDVILWDDEALRDDLDLAPVTASTAGGTPFVAKL